MFNKGNNTIGITLLWKLKDLLYIDHFRSSTLLTSTQINVICYIIIIIPFIFVVFVDHSDSNVETIYEGKTYIKTAKKCPGGTIKIRKKMSRE